MFVSKKNIIIDTLVRLKNATSIYKKSIFIDNTGDIVKFLQVLFYENFISGYKLLVVGGKKKIEIFLSYYNKNHFFNNVRFSKKNAPLYFSLFLLSKMNDTYDKLTIIETPKGFFTLRDAKKYKMGGKFLCQLS